MATIDQKRVTLYGKRARALNKVGKKQKEERLAIIQLLLAGDTLPTGGPCEIELSPCGGHVPYDWRQAYEDVMTKAKMRKHGYSEKVARVLVQADMEAVDNSQPEKPAIEIHGKKYVGGVSLETKFNEKYRQEKSLEEKLEESLAGAKKSAA